MKPTVSIIVPVLNDGEHIDKCLNSIVRSSFRNYEIIVVDDGSLDDTIDKIKKYPCKLTRLKMKGLSFSRNFGAKKSAANILYFVDSDIVQGRNTIKKMVNFLRKNENAKIICSRWHKTSLSKGFVPEFLSLQFFYPIIHWMKSKKIFKGYLGINTGAFMIYKNTFFEVGGFDNKYKKPGGEDYEFSDRFYRNYPIYYQSDIFVFHYFKYFLQTLKNTFWRTSEWTKIFLRKKKFEPYGNATSCEALNAVIISLSISFFIFGFLYVKFFLVSGALFLIFFVRLFKMLEYLAKEKSRLFSVKALFFSSLLYLAKSLGFIYGLLKLVKENDLYEIFKSI